MSIFGRLKEVVGPRHTRALSRDSDVYTDLDKLVTESLKFRFNGEVHELKPLSAGQFYRVANALAALHSFNDKKELSQDEVVNAYYAVVSSVCDTIPKEAIYKMTSAQFGALYTMILEHVNGRSHRATQEDLEKKTLQLQSTYVKSGSQQ